MGGHPDPGSAGPVAEADDSATRLPTGEFAKTYFFEAVLHDVAALAERTPVVLAFEDLHWSDSASSELLDFLVRNLADARVLTLGTYREDELDRDHPFTPWLAELSRHTRVRKLAVAPLSRPELAVLITNVRGSAPSPELLESVWTRAQGNPFFAEELLAADDPVGLPTALKAVIERRVKRLPEQAQRLLEFAATVGTVVDDRLLETAIGWDTDTLEAALVAAIDKKILVVDAAASAYRFRHALLREAVYEALLPAQRRRLHGAIAAALTDVRTDHPGGPGLGTAELAAHWWAASEWAQALPTSVQAADVAIAALAFPEAHAFLDRALLADTKVPAATLAAGYTRPQLLEKAAEIALLAGANARAVELAQEAVCAHDPAADPIAAARCQTLLGRNLWGIGDSAAAFEAYDMALAILPGEAPSVERARLLAEQARAYLLLSQYVKARDLADQALATARAVSTRDVEAHALNTLGACVGELRGFDEGMALVLQSLEIAQELTNPEDLNRAYTNLTNMMLETGRFEEAASMMFDCAAVGEDLWGCRLNGATGNAVEAMVRLGNYPEAERLLALLGNQALGVCAPAPWMLPSPMLIRRGDFAGAESSISHAIDMTSRLGDVQHAATAHALAGELELERRRPEAASAALQRALDLTARTEDRTLLPEVCMWSARAIADEQEQARSAGRTEDDPQRRAAAQALLSKARGVVEGRERRGFSVTARQVAALAQTAAECSRLARSDPDLWDRAAQLWNAGHEAYPEAYCRWREAEAVLEARGARARATAALDVAYRLAQPLQAQPLLNRISHLAQRGRLELNTDDVKRTSLPTQAAEVLGLTPREVEVLGLLADGRSDREIAEILFISKKTVSVHVSNVLRKLAVSRRFEAARIGQFHGLGTPPLSAAKADGVPH
jgi:DNA-binding NarL/FixJ family response regulator